MNRQKQVLFILVIVLLLSMVYSYYRMPVQKRQPKPANVAGVAPPAANGKVVAAAKPATGVTAESDQLQLALLDKQESKFRGFKRNLFKPIFREEVKIKPLPPPPPAPPQRSILPSSKPAATPPTTTAGPPTAVETAKQEIGRLRFLGFLRKDTRKTIFLAEGSEIFLVRKGDKIAGRYQVTALTDDAITITVLADKSDLVFPLVESRALSAGNR